jgi:hypothetical protein
MKMLHLIVPALIWSCTPAKESSTASNGGGATTENNAGGEGSDGLSLPAETDVDGNESADGEGVEGVDNSAGDEGGESADGSDGTNTVQAGNVALGFPEDLVVVSPYSTETVALAAEANQSLTTIKSGTVAISLLGDKIPPPYKQNERKGFATKRAFLSALLRNVDTDDGCVFKLEPPVTRNVTCYGPELKYINHPDGAPASGMLPSGDIGFWVADQMGEACMSAKMNEVVETISNRVDNATGTAAMLLCYARKDGKRLPAVGESLDLMGYATTAQAAGADQTFENAAITRLPDEGGNPVYKTVIASRWPGHHVDLEIKHKPTGENNSSYSGVLKAIVEPLTPSNVTNVDCPGMGSSPDAVKQNGFHVLSVAYKKDDETNLQYEFRTGHFPRSKGITPNSKANLFDGDFAKLPKQSAGDCNFGGEMALYKLNPTTGNTDLSYSWIAGFDMEEARTLVTNLTVTGNDKVGCGYFGFGDKMEDILAERAAANDGTKLQKVLTQFFCNWAGPGSNHMTHSKELVQRQCAKQNTTTGVFERYDMANTENIFFSPQNDCQRTPPPPGPPPPPVFSFCIPTPANNNCGSGPYDPTTTTHQLLDISGAFDKSVLYSPPVFTP